MIRRTLTIIALGLFSAPLLAQDVGVTLSPILTMDSELVFGSTVVGQQITTNLESRVQDLAAENTRMAAELEAEELDLTEKRTTMDTVDFRLLADAFDEKVQRIRLEQDTKQRELQGLRDAERQSFIDAIAPLLSSIARKHGAVAVLERRSVLLSADSIDITQEVIDRIDAALTLNPLGGDPAEGITLPLEDTGETGTPSNP